MLFYITVIRRLITVIRCQTFDNSNYMTADVGCQTSAVIWLLSSIWCYMLCYITVIRRLMSNVRRLKTVIWCQTSKVRHLIWDVCCHLIVIRCLMSFVFYQTSDIRQIISDVWCQTFDIRRLLSYNCYQTSDVCCYQTSDVWFYMLCYITVICCLISDVC